MSRKKHRASSAPVQSPPIALKPVTPAEFWQGEGGREYTERNRVDWSNRLPFWQHILDLTNASSFLEVGTNAGWNLHAIKKLRPDATMTGVDYNEDALREANASGFDVEVMPGHKVAEFFGAGACELAFTSGVLIHVPPEDLMSTMTAIRDVSSQYVLAVEYDYDIAREIEYRGRAGLLWKRPYGKLYGDLGLSLVESGVAEGFDQCHYWLLEK
jgi:pseudaminic acid biosynthesis-associated methylase